MFDRTKKNMRPPSASSRPPPIDQPPSGHSTAPVIGVQDSATKGAVTERAVDEGLHQRALDFVGGLFLTNPIKRFGIANAWECVIVGQAERNDASEVRV